MFAFRLAAAAALTIATVASAPTVAQPAAAQTIALYSYGYNPDPILLTAGRPVTLTFVNRSGSGHDFTARKFFRSSRIIAGSVPDGEIDLRSGQSASVRLVPATGRYKVHCGHPFHKIMGMRGDIIVR